MSSYTYQWQDCDSTGANCTNIGGATSSSYTLTIADVGHTIRAVVTASNAAGSASTSSVQTAMVTGVPPAPPSNTALPQVSGTTTQGGTLTTTTGSWSGSPTAFTYAWQDCNSSGGSCTIIRGASSNTYTLGSGDVGLTIRVVVTASNAGGSASATSAQTATVAAAASGSGSVPCALTHAAGADGTNSCWATHTGVQNGTGYSEAQILAGQSTLTHVMGDQTIKTPGAVISNEWISGCVAIDASNVTIKNSLIYPSGHNCSGGAGGSQASAVNDGQGSSTPTGTLIEDTTVDGNNAVGDQYGVSLIHGECLQCNVLGFAKNFSTGVNTAGDPAIFQDSYSHDLSSNDQCAHADGFFIESGAYITIEHSYSIIDHLGTNCVNGAIDSGGSWGPPSHETITNTYMEGSVNGQDWHGACGESSMQLTNDAFSNNEKGSGPWLSIDAGNVWSGNYTAESPSTGYPAPGPGNC